jgi:tRNA(adenine34) deaminase
LPTVEFVAPQSHDEYFMQQALQEAKRAMENDEVPIGAVLVKDGSVVAVAHNFVEGKRNQLCHAEVMCLNQGFEHSQKKFLYGYDLYCTVEPCTMCIGASILARIDRFVYGADEPKTGAVSSVLDIKKVIYNHSLKISPHVLADPCRQLIREFFQKKRLESRKKY